MSLPKKNRDWAKDLNSAWDEAHSIFVENKGTDKQRLMLYRMAPTLALYQRGLENSQEQAEIIGKTLAGIEFIHRQSPLTAENIKRSFAISYMQAHVHARLLSAKQANDLIGYLEQKGVIEPDLPTPDQVH